MDSEQFLKEVHEYIESTYLEFEEYQRVAFDILVEFDRLCRTNGIVYYLAYGTLLGAVRDKGQIPWDYDIDVQIRIDDKEKLIDALKKYLGTDYYYAYYDNTPKYPAYCIRLGKKGHHFNALHVDVFFLIGCPENFEEQRIFLNRLNKYCDKRIKKHSVYWFSNPKNKLDRIICFMLAIKYFFISEKWLDKEEKYLTTKYSLSNTKYCCSLGKDKKPYFTSSYRSVCQMSINNKSFCVPSGYEEILETIYDNWQTYTSVSSRFNEFYKMLSIVKERDNNS